MNRPDDAVRSVLNQLPLPVIVTERGGVVLWWNRASGDLFHDEIMEGTSIFSYLDIEKVPGSDPLLISDGEEETRFSNISLIRPGLNKTADAVISLLRCGEDELLLFTIIESSHVSPVSPVTGDISAGEDITYLKRTEEDLKQSEEKLRILFESLPEGILVTDLDGNIIQVNRAYLRIFGYADRVMLSGKNIHEIFESAGDYVIVELFSLAMNRGHSGVVNYKLHRDETVYIDLQALMISDEDGAPRGFLILADDVSDRRRAEQALRESEARNRALVEAIPDIMFRMNNRGVYLDKMLGTKINEVFPPEIASDAVRLIAEAVKTREIQIFEYPVTISMEERYYEARFIAIEDDEVLIIIRNTTEKRRALDEIENARREAELASRAKSEFLANMSHEIRTPLNSITGFIELLMRTKIDQAQKEYLNIIKKSASNLLEIINDILDFSKIESHRMEISPVEFDPCHEFESVIRLFNVKAQEKGIKLISFIDPLLPSVVISDPLRLKQILSNLLSNAIKFTPEKGTVIAEIKLFRIKGDRCMITFSVSDTGIGIPERKQKQIFEAFTQADSSVTRKYGGTGLGLSISSSLAKLLGSEIVLESRMGIGSKFYFTIEAEIVRERTMRDAFPSFSGFNAAIVSYSSGDMALLNLEFYLQCFGFNIGFVSDLGNFQGSGCDILFVIYSDELVSDLAVHAERVSAVPAVLVTGSGWGELPADLRGIFRHAVNQPVFPESFVRIIVKILGFDSAGLPEPREAVSVKGAGFRGRVLVGEDNRTNQKLMMLLLRDYGVEADIAGNGLDVFSMFRRGGYDLVLMDINMPVADGIETAGMILDYERETGLPHTPVIALTAKVLQSDRDSMTENGMDGYLAKPVEMEKLEEVLARYLEIAEVKHEEGISESGDTHPAGCGSGYNVAEVAAELKIPVNVLESIGRDFFEEGETNIADMRLALSESDYEALRGLSHRMNGAAANLRFTALSAFLSAVEENSASGNKEFDYEKTFNDIECELGVLRGGFE